MIVIDSEWNWKTGEFLALGVWKNGRYSAYTDLSRGKMLHEDVYYFASSRDIAFFAEKFGTNFNFVEITQIQRLMFNVSGEKERTASLTQQMVSRQLPIEVRAESHLYTEATPAMLRDLRGDVLNTVCLTKYMLNQFGRSKIAQPQILREWGAGNILYASQHNPVLIDRGFIADLGNVEKIGRVVDAIDPDRIAFQEKTKVVTKGPYRGTERVYVNLNQKGLQQLYSDLGLEFLNQTNLAGHAYGKFRKEVFNTFDDAHGVLDRADQIRTSENLVNVDQRVAFFTVVLLRSARVLGDVCVPLIIPKATTSGRSKHSISPYNMGGLVRANIYAGEGRAIISFDIAGQELRLGAYLSGDEKMLKIANSKEKYSLVAEILGYPPTAGAKGSALRDQIKTVWLQYQYGGGAALLFANGVIDEKQQVARLHRLQGAFTEYEAWKRDVLGEAARRGYAEASPGGLRLYYNPGVSADARAHNARQIQNFVVQGGAATVVYPWMKDVNSRLLKGDYIACELYDGLYLNVDIDRVDYYLHEIPKSAGVWDERFPMAAGWQVEPQADQRDKTKLYFVHGVVEKDKYIEMGKAWERMMSGGSHARTAV